jgi:glycerophosphoryl diester phosphodiesterase
MRRLLPFLLFVSFSCHPSKKIVSMPAETFFHLGFDKEGHRGCRGLMPENTIPAMLHALDLGVTTLEMDAVITKDGKVVLSHEQWFSAEITTKPDGGFISAVEEMSYNIYRMDYVEVRTFDVGMKPHPRFPQQKKLPAVKPLLEDVIDSAEQHAMAADRPLPFYNIETKTLPATDNIFHPPPQEFVDLLMKSILKKNIIDRVIIQSFDFRTLQYLHKKYPSVKTAMLIDGNDKKTFPEQLTALGFIPSIYSPESTLVKEQLVSDCHNHQIRLVPWTVNDPKEIDRLKMMGVDGLISDYPNRF